MKRSLPVVLASLLPLCALAQSPTLVPAEVVFDSTPATAKPGPSVTPAPAVYLHQSGKAITWNGRALDRTGLQAYVASLVRESHAVYIVLTVDPSTQLGEMVHVLDELRTTGVTKVLIRPPGVGGE